jgi:hypothetical protein
MKIIKFFCHFLLILTITSCDVKFFYKNKFEANRHHKMSKVLREIFDFYSKINCRSGATVGAREFDNRQFAMIKEKFLVLHIEKEYFSESLLYIAIAPKGKPEQIKIWRLSIQEDRYEKIGYSIDKFDEYDFVSKDGIKWPFEEYAEYWM